MSSAATRNARPDAVRRRGSNRGGGSGEESRRISFTLVFDTLTDEVVLDEHQSVRILKLIVESRFKIPMNKQLIYGWPGVEPRDNSLQFKDLGLDSNVLLYVAAVDGIEDQEALLDIPDTDGARPGSSRSTRQNSTEPSPSRPKESSKDSSRTYQLHVRDMKNNEMYDEVPVEGYQSILEVKEIFAGITGISIELQEWSGWPEGVSDDQLLKDIDLDKPFHSLALMEVPQTGSIEESQHISQDAVVSSRETETPNSKVKTDRDSPKATCSPVSITQPHIVSSQESEGIFSSAIEIASVKSENVESKRGPSTRTARKSTSKGALRDLQRTTNQIHTSEENLSFTVETAHGNSMGGRSMHENDLSNNMIDENSSQPSGSTTHEDRKRLLENLPGPSTPKKIKSSDELSSPTKSPRKHRDRNPSLLIELPEKGIPIVLRHLDPLSQLSLRRVCKITKGWVSRDREKDEHSEEEKWKRFSLTVTGQDHKTFETVIDLNLPITRFVLDTTNPQFYLREDSRCFRKVKDVTLKQFFMFQHTEERKMFESFVCLEKLTIDDLSIPTTTTVQPCPKILGQLQVLKLNYRICIPEANVLIRPKSWDMTWGMLADCQSLLYFRFPRINETKSNLTNSFGIFAPLLDYISTRVNGGGVSLEYLDMKHFNNPQSFYINRFVDLLRRCYYKDIKLKNVSSLVIQEVFDDDVSISDDKLKFCENIVSLINYRPFLENAPLRNLEKITVDIIPSVTGYMTLGKNYKDMFWPKLRAIKITDTEQLEKREDFWTCWQEVQEDLYGHNGIFDRGSVKYIKIDSPKLPYFLSEGRLAQKFYSLKRLEIVSWCSTDRVLNKRLHVIWKKLSLEELRIENCPRLNDSSFTGEDEQEDDNDENGYASSSPPFLNLIRSLKKVTLGLDETNVTDESLIRVFSRMPLKTFILLSSRPTKITEKGLLKLRERTFGENIEYFPFDCWQAAKIDPRRFERLGKSFRSMR